jgi:hypothetical protein
MFHSQESKPNSLCNVSYKIISKIVASRIQKFIPKLISPSHRGFVAPRQIWDNIVQVQETIHSSKIKGDKGMVIKINMANDFDSVWHIFLLRVLERFGFHPSIVKWIAACLIQPWITPLINGRPSRFFQSSIGLRHRCPLSPILYILMEEVLGRRLEQERISRGIPRIKIAVEIKQINHSQFEDDVLLLGGESSIIARKFKLMLNQFLYVSGRMVNSHKCYLYA